MQYEVYGPYRIPTPIGWIRKPPAEWWRGINAHRDGLSDAKGIYVFGIRTSGSERVWPWYVGKTQRKSFFKECFGSHKLNKYNQAFNQYHRARPCIFFLPRLTSGGKFSWGSGKKDIAFLEEYLIMVALQANSSLLNEQNTKYLRRLVLPGMLNWSGTHPGGPAVAFRWSMLG